MFVERQGISWRLEGQTNTSGIGPEPIRHSAHGGGTSLSRSGHSNTSCYSTSKSAEKIPCLAKKLGKNGGALWRNASRFFGIRRRRTRSARSGESIPERPCMEFGSDVVVLCLRADAALLKDGCARLCLCVFAPVLRQLIRGWV